MDAGTTLDKEQDIVVFPPTYGHVTDVKRDKAVVYFN